MIPFLRIAKPIGIAALMLGATQAWHTSTRPGPPAAKPAQHTAGLPQGGTYLRPWMDEARPYSPVDDRLFPYYGALMHDRYDEMVIDWSDGTTDWSKDLLRFTFNGHWVNEAWTAAHSVDRHDAQVLWPNPPAMTEVVLACAEAPYHERVLAHLRASLTLPAGVLGSPATEEPPVEEMDDNRRYGIQAAPMSDAPTQGVRALLQRYADASADMDPGIYLEAPDEELQHTTEMPQEDRLRLLEELQRLLPGDAVKQSEEPNNTKVP